MRFLIPAAVATIVATLTCGTHVNAQIDSEIEALKSLAASTGGWENVSSGAWSVDNAKIACGAFGCSDSDKCGAGGWTDIKCERINSEDRVVEIRFPAKINGTIAAIDFNKLPFLRFLRITQTELTGALPNLSTHPTLKTLEIESNPKLLGPITTPNIPPQLERITINGIDIALWNQGSLPSFDAVNATTLKHITFDHAQVTGTLPSFEKFINLGEFYMRGNNITGGVPRFGPSLRILSLSKNELTAFDVSVLPPSVGSLDLSSNKIVAPFPDFSKLTDPYSIDLSENGFYGDVSLNRIPVPLNGQNVTDINGDTYSYRLNFNSNALTGPVPNITTSWLQSRAPPGINHILRWTADCNLFQTGLPSTSTSSIPPFQSICYDNKDQQCTNCKPKLPGTPTQSVATTTPPTSTTAPPTSTTAPPTSTTAPPTSTTAPPSLTTAPPTNKPTNATTITSTPPTNKPTNPPSSTGPAKPNDASSAANSMFTGVIAVCAAALARSF